MKINYTILWFDDDKSFIDSLDIEPLKNSFAQLGFELELVFVHDVDEFAAQAPYTQFDLLIVDFNLESNETGDYFIKSIQDNSVYTEVIFYSANQSSELWGAIASRKLEGVFVANRRQVTTKLIAVAKQSVRKVLDLANMRGIVMASVADLDHLLSQILHKAVSLLDHDRSTKLFKKFADAGRKQVSQHEKKYEDFSQVPTIDGLVKLCDSDKRWQNITRVKALDENMKRLCKDLGDFRTEVLSPRNYLAHGIGTEAHNGTVIFEFSGRSYEFSEAESVLLRQRISRYRREFLEILRNLEATANPGEAAA